MQFILKVYYTNDKQLDLILNNKDELDGFLNAMANNTAYFDKSKNSGVGIPLYQVKYYNFFEYTEEMRKASEKRVQEQQEKEIEEDK